MAKNRRDKILDAALEAFSEKGYHGSSIRMIAKKAGITEGLIYHYFKSKEDLFNAIVDRAMEFRDAVLNSIRLDLSLEENIIEVKKAFIELIAQNPSWIKFIKMMMLLAPTSDNEKKRAFASRIEQGMQILGNLLDLKSEKGELRRTNGYFTSRFLIGGFMAFFITQHILGIEEYRHVDFEEYLSNTMDVFVNGVKRE